MTNGSEPGYSFHPEAQAEAQFAADEYDSISEDLGDHFEEAYNEALDSILESPESWALKIQSEEAFESILTFKIRSESASESTGAFKFQSERTFESTGAFDFLIELKNRRLGSTLRLSC